MLRDFVTIGAAVAAGWLWAQGLEVRMGPEQVYLGDAFSVQVEVAGQWVHAVFAGGDGGAAGGGRVSVGVAAGVAGGWLGADV